MAGGPWVEIGGEGEELVEVELGDTRPAAMLGELPVFLRRPAGAESRPRWLAFGSGELPAPRRHAGLGVGIATLLGFSALLGVVSFCAGYLAGLVRLLGPYSQ
jgi:hypothetical protein